MGWDQYPELLLYVIENAQFIANNFRDMEEQEKPWGNVGHH